MAFAHGLPQDRDDPGEFRAGPFGRLWEDDVPWPWPIPDDKETTTVNLPPWVHRREPRAQAPESLLVQRARYRHWKLEGATATAGPTATLGSLAEAITGNRADYKLLDFPRSPRTLRVGDRVNIVPLLEKAAGKRDQDTSRTRTMIPGNLEKGDDLGTFLVTVYNVAREEDHPAAPVKRVEGLDRLYSESFLRDIRMQGSGIDRDGRLIQLSWEGGEISGFAYVDVIRTASGAPLQPEISIAADPRILPLGTWVYIDTIGWRKVTDTGGKIVGRHIDVYLAVPRAEAMKMGTKHLKVWRAR